MSCLYLTSFLLNNKINKSHERALRLVYKDRNLSFTQLLDMDKSVSVHHRNLQKPATEMFKVKHDLSPRFMHTIFASSKNPYNLRYDSSFKTENIRTVTYGSETLSYRGPELWTQIPSNIKYSSTLGEFKAKIKSWKPVECKCRLCKRFIPNIGFSL